MKRVVLASLALVACATTAPQVAVHPPNPARTAALALAAEGKIDRAVRSLAALDASDPVTAPDTEAEELTWLAELSRCNDVRTRAARVGLGNAVVALRALAMCDRIERPPSPEALATMRSRFHEAVALEKSDPTHAVALYEDAWAAAPTGAVMLGLARAARAKGDAALAERSFERALGWAERGGARPRLVIGLPHALPSVKHPRASLSSLSFGKSAAIFQVAIDEASDRTRAPPWVVRQDYKTNDLDVVMPGEVSGFSPRYAIPKALHGALLEIGVDDETTAQPIPALDHVTSATFSPNDKIVFALQSRDDGSRSILVDLASGREVWSAPQMASGLFVGDDAFLLDPDGRVPCILSAPTWKTCVDLPNLTVADGGARLLVGNDLVLGTDDRIEIYDFAARRVRTRFDGHFRSVTSFALSPNGKYLLSRSESRVVAWDLATGAHWRTNLRAYDAEVSFSAGGSYLIDWAMNDGIVQLYDATKLPALVDVSQNFFAPLTAQNVQLVDGRFLLGGTVTALVDVRSGAITRFPCPTEDAFVYRSRWVLCGSDVFDLAGEAVSGNELTSIREGAQYIEHLPTSASDGAITVAAIDGSFVVTDAAKGTSSELVVGPNGAIVPSGDGKSRIIGDEAHVQCRVGDVWLPLDACRDRLLAP